MIIGIDIDDTLTETSIYANSLLDENVVDYHNLDKDKLRLFIQNNIKDIALHADLKKDSIDTLKYWKSLGYKIVFVTARGNEEISIPATMIYFKKKEVPFDKVVFIKNSKVDTCFKENIDIFIDDKEKVLDEIKQKGIKTYMMGGNSCNHEVVRSWSELRRLVGNER